MAERKKKEVHRVQMTEGKRNIIRQLLEEYDIQSAEDIQDALKDLLGGTIKEMMEADGYTGALKAPVRCFGNHLSGKGKSSFQTDNECSGAAILKK